MHDDVIVTLAALGVAGQVLAALLLLVAGYDGRVRPHALVGTPSLQRLNAAIDRTLKS